jgi:glycosyltransferase involved in cell wall biosynthesis
MFEAMAAAKPIVLAVEGEAQRTLERAGAGVAVAPGDGPALCAAVQALADNPVLRQRLGAAGARFVKQEFSRSAWARRYLEILAVSATRIPARAPNQPEAA